MRTGALYSEITGVLGGAGIEVPELEARMILRHRAGVEWAAIIAAPERPVDAQAEADIHSDVARRIAGEPLSRIQGVREFYGLEFALSSATLDPRADTETVIDVALRIFAKAPPRRILDLGTGTGCLPVTLLTRWPAAVAVAVDLSEDALRTARANAERHGVDARFMPLRGDWAESLRGPFDLIVSNPPYIVDAEIADLESGVRNHDPILALAGGADGLQAYKRIFSRLAALMNPDSTGLFEIGIGQGDSIARLAEEYRIRVIARHDDLRGITRVLKIGCGDK